MLPNFAHGSKVRLNCAESDGSVSGYRLSNQVISIIISIGTAVCPEQLNDPLARCPLYPLHPYLRQPALVGMHIFAFKMSSPGSLQSTGSESVLLHFSLPVQVCQLSTGWDQAAFTHLAGNKAPPPPPPAGQGTSFILAS